MISQHFIESPPFSSPDESPKPRNLLVSFVGLNDPLAHVQYRKTLCPRRDDVLLANFERVRGFDTERKFMRRPTEYSLSNFTPFWANRNFGADRSNSRRLSPHFARDLGARDRRRVRPSRARARGYYLHSARTAGTILPRALKTRLMT
jgi:hypothetical protein